jgi:ketosteroid isomerase-like protein
MNEQQNTALIQKLYDSFAKGDIQTILDNLTDDVEWGLEGPAIIAFAGQKKGREQVKGFFEALATTQRGMKLTVDQFVAQDNRVASTGRYAATVTATGKSFDSPVAHFFEIRDGKVARFVDFGDTAAFAEAYTQASAATR